MKMKKQIIVIICLTIIMLVIKFDSKHVSEVAEAEVVLGNLQYTLDVGKVVGTVYCDIYSNDSGVTFSAVVRGSGVVATNKLPFGNSTAAIYNTSLVNLIFEDGSSIGFSYDKSASACKGLLYADLAGLDSSKSTIANSSMFDGCSNLVKIDNADKLVTSNISSIGYLFGYCTKLEYINGAENWNLSNVTTMFQAFKGCNSLKVLDTTNWDVSKVENMEAAFYECKALMVVNMSRWSITKVKTARAMFFSCEALLEADLKGWKSYDLLSVEKMFEWCKSIKTIDMTGFYSGAITNFNYFASECNLLESVIGTGSLDLTSLQTMGNAFMNCKKLMSIELNSNTPNLTTISVAFSGCTSLTTAKLYINMDKVTSLIRFMVGCSSLTDLTGEETWNLNSNMSMENTFNGCKLLVDISTGTWGLSNCKSMYQTFYNCYALTYIYGNENWNLSACKTLESTFMYCYKIESLDGTNWSLVAAENMSHTFQFCGFSELTGEENWDLSCVTNMFQCFADGSGSDITKGLKVINGTNWGLESVINASAIFSNNYALEDIVGEENWSLASCTNMQSTFAGTGLYELNITGWKTSLVSNFSGTFTRMSRLTEIKGFENLDFSSATTIANLFRDDKMLTSINLSGKNLVKCTNIDYLMSGCNSLVAAYMSNLNLDNVLSANSVFNGCIALKLIDMSNTTMAGVTSSTYFISGSTLIEKIYTPLFFKSSAVLTAATKIDYMKYNGVYTYLTDKSLPLNLSYTTEYLAADIIKLVYDNGAADLYEDIVGGKITNKEIPVKENWVFSGFNDKADGTGKMYINSLGVYNTALIIPDNTTLYAIWTPKIIEVQVPTNINVSIDGNTRSIESDAIEVKNLSSMSVNVSFKTFEATANSEVLVVNKDYWDYIGGWGVLNAEQTEFGVAMRLNECSAAGSISIYGRYSGEAASMLDSTLLKTETKYFKIDGLTGPAWSKDYYFDFNLKLVISE